MSIQPNSVSYGTAVAGTAIAGLSLAAVNNQDKIIEILSPVVTTAINALSQSTGSIVGTAIGTTLVLDALTSSDKDSYLQSAYKIARNTVYSIVGSVGLVSLAHTDIPGKTLDAATDLITGPGKDCMNQVVNGLVNTVIPAIESYAANPATYAKVNYTVFASAGMLALALANRCAADEAKAAQERREAQLKSLNAQLDAAEKGDKATLENLFNKFVNNQLPRLDANSKTRLGNLIKAQIKELHKTNRASALLLLATCFTKGLGVHRNDSAALVCVKKAAELKHPFAIEQMVIYKNTLWNPPIVSDDLTDQLIESCL